MLSARDRVCARELLGKEVALFFTTVKFSLRQGALLYFTTVKVRKSARRSFATAAMVFRERV
jgi:hypothetical protein